MIVSKALKDDLVKQVKSLEGDLRSQTETVPEVFDRLRGEYNRAFKLGRTAATWASWRDERVTQAAAAWVLGTVFVRFCEDNGLLTQPYAPLLVHDAGPLTRYDAGDVLFDVAGRARKGGAPVWLLCPMNNPEQQPRLDGALVPAQLPSEWIVLPAAHAVDAHLFARVAFLEDGEVRCAGVTAGRDGEDLSLG